MKLATANGPTQASQSVDALMEQGQRSLELGDIPSAKRDFAGAIALDPDNVEAIHKLGIAQAVGGRMDDALSCFCAVLTKDPMHRDARLNLEMVLAALAERGTTLDSLLNNLELLKESADNLNGDESLVPILITRAAILGEKLFAARRPECIDAARVALMLRPNPLLGHVNINNYLSALQERARLDDYTRDLTADQLGQKLFIACYPKSGSTLIKKLLREATGYEEAQFAMAYGQNEQELYLPCLLDGARRNLVVQQHCLPTGSSLHMMQAFGIRPIILVRNIFDVLLSWKEFLDAGAFGDTFYSNYSLLSDEQRYALVVDDRAPWYLNFFAGWQRAVASGQIDGLWVTYENLIADPRGAIELVLKFQGIAPDPAQVAKAAELAGRKDKSTRFNRGVVGRGSKAFSAAQVEQIRRIAEYHPDADFSLIGL